MSADGRAGSEREVRVAVGPVPLDGDLAIPAGAHGLVLFAHGSGSGRHSPRNRAVAEALRAGGLGTLLLDLLTPDEEEADRATAHLRFDIDHNRRNDIVLRGQQDQHAIAT